jgi:hypothetical protein
MMRRFLSVTAALTITLAAPSAAFAAPAHPTMATHACTRTSSGSCIRGGEFCKQSEYGQKGYAGDGRTYVCKGSRVHPHWEIP